MNKFLISLFFLFYIGCLEVSVPKPKSFLYLFFPNAEYEKIDSEIPFKFEKNKIASLSKFEIKNKSKTFNLSYKNFNAEINLSYSTLKNNFEIYVNEAEFITNRHEKLANELSKIAYENSEKRVYANLYELTGPVASQCQFYATDSLNHFLSGALYFKIKPNYDSIMPAVKYLKNDIERLIESLEWKNQD